MRRKLLVAPTISLLWLACQPIIIGTPAESGAGTSSASGAAGEGGAGGSLLPEHSGMRPIGTLGGAAGEAPGAAGDAGEAGAPSECVEGTLRLEGRVLSEYGAPVVGVRVELTAETPLATTTDRRGHYAFENLCPGSYRVVPLCAANGARLTLDSDTVRDFTGLAGSCDVSAVKPRVLLITYDPIMIETGDSSKLLSATLGLDPPDVLAQRVFDELRAATNGHLQIAIASTLPIMDFPPLQGVASYTASEYADCLANAESCRDVAVDFSAIAAQRELCDLAQDRRLDQIWLLGGARFGFQEAQQLECAERPDTQEGARKVDVLGLSYGAGLAGLLAGFQGYADRALREVFGDDETDNPYAVSGHAFSSYQLDGSEPVQGCASWGCSELGFRRYWFSQLPRARWLDSDGRFNDFWRYLVRPADRLPREQIAVACSSSWLPGWCEHVWDDVKGECNSGEWATESARTGWVEFLFEPPRLVSGVQLYDRACDEQVLSGHLEFSDGSSDEPFGELQQKGTDFKSINFAPKLLSGLRVVIDSGTGGNPGFGEITLISHP